MLLQLNLMILVVLVRGVTVGGAWSQELERWQVGIILSCILLAIVTVVTPSDEVWTR